VRQASTTTGATRPTHTSEGGPPCRERGKTPGLVSVSSAAATTSRSASTTAPRGYAEADLDRADALTGHDPPWAPPSSAPSSLFPDQGALREWGYVARSRARTETHLYLAERDALERETPLRELSAEPLALDQKV
jgi:hypothetical protein